MRLVLIISSMLLGCNPLLTPLEASAPQALVVTPSRTRVLWVLDTSGSLSLPVDPSSPLCPMNCGPGVPCPSGCATRKALISEGLERFTSTVSSEGHVALPYPGSIGLGTIQDQCAGPERAMAFEASELAPWFASRAPAGGTPTGAALTFAATVAAPDFTDTVVVLVTDGFPNCNPNNAHNTCSGNPTPEQIQACQCVSGNCMTNTLCSLGCKDDLGTAAAASAFTPLGYQLMVLTVGSDFDITIAPFSDMKIDLSPADSKTFQVRSAGDFTPAITRLDRALKEAHRCTWWLDREVTRETLLVTLDRVDVPDSDWGFRGEGGAQRVVFTGASCDRLLADETLTPGLMFSFHDSRDGGP